MKDVTEFPTEDGAAGQWQADGVGPEGKGAFLMVSAQNDTLDGQGQVEDTLKCGQWVFCRQPLPLGGPWHFLQFPKFSSTLGYNNWSP